jgi:hypothetical protein
MCSPVCAKEGVNCASSRLVITFLSRYACMWRMCGRCLFCGRDGVEAASRHVRSSTTYTLLLAHFVHSTYVCFRLLRVSTCLYRCSDLTNLYHDISMQVKSTKGAGTTARATARASASTATVLCTKYVFRPQLCCAFCGCCGHIGGGSVGNSRSIIVKRPCWRCVVSSW